MPSFSARRLLLAILPKDLLALFGYGYLQATRLDAQNEAPDLWTAQSHRTLAHADLAHVQDVVAEHGQTSAVLIASVPLTGEA